MATTAHVKVSLAPVPRIKASPELKEKSTTFDLSFTATRFPSIVSHYPPKQTAFSTRSTIAASTSAATVPERAGTAATATSAGLTTALTTDIGSTRTIASSALPTRFTEPPSPSPLSLPSSHLTLSPILSLKLTPVVHPPTIHSTAAHIVAPLPLSHSSTKAPVPTAKTAFTTRYVTTVSVITITTLIPQRTRVSGIVTTIYVTRTMTTLITTTIPDPSQVPPLPFPSSSSTNQDATASMVACWQFVVGIVAALVIAFVVTALLFRGRLNKRQREQAIHDFLVSSNGRAGEGGKAGRMVEGAGLAMDQGPIFSGRTAWGGRGKGRQDYDDTHGYGLQVGSPSSTVVSGHDFGPFYLHYQPTTAPPALPESWYQAPTPPSFPPPPPPIGSFGIPVTRGNTDRGSPIEGPIWIEGGVQTLHSFPLELRTAPSHQRDLAHLKKSNTGNGGERKYPKVKNRFQWPWKALRSASASDNRITIPAYANTVPTQEPPKQPRNPHALLVSSSSVEAERPEERQQNDPKGKQKQAPRNPHGEPNAIGGFARGDLLQDRRAPQGPYPMSRLPPPISVTTRFWENTNEGGEGSGSGSSSNGGGGIPSRCQGSSASPTVVEPESRLSTSTAVVSAHCSSSPIWSNTLVTMVGDRSQMQANLDNQRTWPGPRGGHGHRGGRGGVVVDSQSTFPAPLLTDQLEKFSKIELLRRGPHALLPEQSMQDRS